MVTKRVGRRAESCGSCGSARFLAATRAEVGASKATGGKRAPLRFGGLRWRSDCLPVLGLAARRRNSLRSLRSTPFKQSATCQLLMRAARAGHEPCAPQRLRGAAPARRLRLCWHSGGSHLRAAKAFAVRQPRTARLLQPGRFNSTLGSFSRRGIVVLPAFLGLRVGLWSDGTEFGIRVGDRGSGARQVQPTRASDSINSISNTHPKAYCWAAASTAARKPPISSRVGMCKVMPKL